MNKEIYVVLSCDYESSEIIAVYDEKEKAEMIVEINPSRYMLKKYEINKLTDEGVSEITEYIKDLKEDLGLE